MMTEQLEVSILAAPLAAIDRRVLSQAWYAALRLGRQALPPSAAISSVPRPAPSRAPMRGVRSQRPLSAVTLAPRTSVLRSQTTKEARIGEVVEWKRSSVARAPHPRLAGCVEKPSGDGRCRRATFSVGRGGARILVAMQTRGNRTTLVAFCRPDLSAAVRRALAQVRVALQAHGIDAELREHGGLTCS